MFCTECGKEIEAGTIFCPNCGKTVEGSVTISSRVSSVDRQKKLISPTKILITAIVIIIVGILIMRGPFLQGCGSSKSQFLGKWREVGKTEVMEFFKDGRVSITDKGMTAAGSWAVLDDGRVKIEANLLGMTVVGIGTLKGDTLRINISGEISEYKKIPS
ncbi:MAG: zinc-ribbon domain-containing protein [candidate division Zixibacteria bacterium]|nr:zinc-ribbon domain-containing protein [candidate division Zixibacteria bacterium]